MIVQVGRELIHRDSRCLARTAAPRRTYQSSFQQLEVASPCNLSSWPDFSSNDLFVVIILDVNTVGERLDFVSKISNYFCSLLFLIRVIRSYWKRTIKILSRFPFLERDMVFSRKRRASSHAYVVENLMRNGSKSLLRMRFMLKIDQ